MILIFFPKYEFMSNQKKYLNIKNLLIW